MTFNGKEIGKDRFEKVDIQVLDDAELLEYKIAVMQWCREGGDVEMQYHEDADRLILINGLPIWNWERLYYFPVPKPSYKPYEKAEPNWLVKTDEVVKWKGEDRYGRVNEIGENDSEPVQLNNDWFTLHELFTGFEWYSLATGETRPFGELLNPDSQEKSN